MPDTSSVDIVRIQPFQALAVRTPMTSDNSGTRTAWRTLTDKIPLSDPRRINTDTAYVFIPQAMWATGVSTLWVGLTVREFGDVPAGIEALEIPESLCAKLRVHGNEAHMKQAYQTMFGWLQDSKEYELDTREGVLGMEANRLTPINPLTIPYREVETFDFDMLYPIIKR